MYWKRVSEVMEQLRYPEHEWSEKRIEVARNRKSWKQVVSEIVKEYKQEFDYDTWENRHTEQNTSYEREVRQAIEELDDQGRACCPRCGGWQYNIRVHLSRCRPPEDLPPGTPEGPRLRPREGSKSEKTQCGACGKWRVDMYSHKRFCRGLDEEPPGANQVRGEWLSRRRRHSQDQQKYADGNEASSPSRTKKYDVNEKKEVQKDGWQVK